MQKQFVTVRMRKYMLLSLLYISGPAFILISDPARLPLPLLVLPFLWLFVVLFVTSWVLLKNKKNLSRRQVTMVSGVIASIPVLLAIFQSIHQLSLRDVLLSVGLVFFAAWYMMRADFIR